MSLQKISAIALAVVAICFAAFLVGFLGGHVPAGRLLGMGLMLVCASLSFVFLRNQVQSKQ